MTFIQPLDLQYLFVNTFAGSWDLFMILAFLAIAGMAAFFRMPNVIAAPMIVLFGVFMAIYSANFYFLIVIFAAISIFYGIGNLIKR